MSANDHKPIDKTFLRQNDLVHLIDQALPFYERYRTALIGVVVLAVVAVSGYFYMQHERKEKIEAFNERMTAVEKLPQKIEAYRAIATEFDSIPAVNLARLKLAANLLENQKTDEAVQALDQGLNASSPDIFTTLLVLKKVDIFKAAQKYDLALKALRDGRSKVIVAFQNELSLIEAQLCLLSGQKEEARKIYDQLAQLKVELPVNPETDVGIDETVISTAKDQLLLLDLGVL